MLQRLSIIRADRARDTGRRSHEAERDDSISRAAHARRKA